MKHSFLLLALGLLLPILGWSAPTADEHTVLSGKCGRDLTFTLSDAGELAISGTGDMFNFSQPGQSGSVSPWYDMRASITSVSLPDGLTHIGDWAFAFCEKIGRVNLPASVKTVGTLAFGFCSGMQRVDVPSVEYLARQVKFANSFSNPIKYAHHFYVNDEEVTGTLTIPNTVTELGDYAFVGATEISKIEFPNTLTSIGEGSFMACSGLKDNFNEFRFPASLLTIKKYAFMDCPNITKVYAVPAIRTIGEQAFYCSSTLSSLNTIVLGPYVESIGQEAFSCGVKNPSIGLLRTTPPTIQDNTFEYYRSDDTKPTLKVEIAPSNIQVSTYMNANVWKDYQWDWTQRIDNAYMPAYCEEPEVNISKGVLTVTSPTPESHMIIKTGMNFSGTARAGESIGFIPQLTVDVTASNLQMTAMQRVYTVGMDTLAGDADINHDGRISIADLVELINQLQNR